MRSLVSRLLAPLAPRALDRGLRELALPAATEGSTLARAALGGFETDRLGYAFVCGYQAALARLVPGLAARACFAATERAGAHPRAIQCALTPVTAGAYHLDGTKTWITLGTEADELLVVARLAGHEGKGSLRVARVPCARAGITLTAGAPLPFAPEVPHAEARFEGVLVEAGELLEGDGYDQFLKPFRTIEDLHVLASTLGYLLRVARTFAWPREFVERALVTLLALERLGELDPRAPTTHVALGGAFTLARGLLDESEAHWELAEAGERARWRRDRALLTVADRARTARLEAAWRQLL